MNDELKFLTHEVGSLAKPPWLVKTSAGKPLEESDIEHARTWGEKVGVEDHEQLVELLEQDERDPDEIARWASKYCVRLQESAGVDVIWDGEQQRSEMYALGDRPLQRLRAARHGALVRQQVLLEVGGDRPRLARASRTTTRSSPSSSRLPSTT